MKILISEYTQVEAGKTADGDPLILITHSAGNAVVLHILFQLSHSSYNTMALFPRYSYSSISDVKKNYLRLLCQSLHKILSNLCFYIQ